MRPNVRKSGNNQWCPGNSDEHQCYRIEATWAICERDFTQFGLQNEIVSGSPLLRNVFGEATRLAGDRPRSIL
jgi:hypothetical protein